MSIHPHVRPTTVQMLREVPERVAILEQAKADLDARMGRHEDTCSDRYDALDDQLVRLHERIDKMLYLQLGGMLSAILALIGIVVQLLRTH